MQNCGWYQNLSSDDIYFKTSHNQTLFFRGKKLQLNIFLNVNLGITEY